MAADNISPLTVGFYRTCNIRGIYSAALLITDVYGFPLEFKYVLPLVPDQLQKAVYGASLDEYLHSRMLKNSVLGQLESTPALFLTSFDEWTLHEQFGSYRLLAIREELAPDSRQKAESLATGSLRRATNGDYLLHSSLFRVIRIKMAGGDETGSGPVLDLLSKLDISLDLLEPLGRIEQALQTICQKV